MNIITYKNNIILTEMLKKPFIVLTEHRFDSIIINDIKDIGGLCPKRVFDAKN